MTFLKYALPVLAVSHLALAQCGNSSAPIKIQNQSDADGYQGCSAIQGDIEIDQHYTGDLTFNGVQQIVGSLKCTGASNLTSINAPSLNSIGQAFHLDGLTTLTTLGFTQLSKVGSIEWVALPNLQTLSFTTGVANATSVSIQNTGLTTLDGISLDRVGDFQITNNNALQTVNVNNLKQCDGLLNFAANSPQLQITLPNLASAVNMTFRNVSSVDIPSLKKLKGQLGFFGDTFSGFSAANLTETGDLVFDGNKQLSNISMPNLQTVNGGFQIARNDKLMHISFPALKTIIGALDFSGSFTTVDLPSLKEVKGGFNMQSTGKFDCSPYQKDAGNIILGTFTCKAATSTPTTKNGSSGTSSGTSSSASPSKGAAVAKLANMPAMGVAAVFGALFAL